MNSKAIILAGAAVLLASPVHAQRDFSQVEIKA